MSAAVAHRTGPKTLQLQLAKCVVRERVVTLPAALLHGGRKAPHAVYVLLFMLDGETGPALLDRQPHGAAHKYIGTELHL